MSIKIVKPTKPYGDEWYPFFIGTFRDSIREFKAKEFANTNMLRLSYFSLNTWDALAKLVKDGLFEAADIGSLYAASKYECPLTRNTYRALLPVAIFSDDVTKYFGGNKPWYYDMAIDQSWNCPQDGSHLEMTEIAPIDRCILGPGYTDYTLPNDGSPDILFVVIDLSNGDKIVALANAWYNK